MHISHQNTAVLAPEAKLELSVTSWERAECTVQHIKIKCNVVIYGKELLFSFVGTTNLVIRVHDIVLLLENHHQKAKEKTTWRALPS